MKTVRRPDLALFTKKRVPVQLQDEISDCGLACLAMIAGYHGLRIDLSSMRRRWELSGRGLTLAVLAERCRNLDLVPRALRLEPDSLGDLRLPCILHWGLDHFVVLERVRRRRVEIVDPATGRRSVGAQELDRLFTGVALELTPGHGFRKEKQASRFRLRELLHGTAGLGRALAQLLAFSLALQVFALLLPFYSQVVIDEVVVTGDLELLNLLLVVFGFLVFLQSTVSLLRSWVIVYAGIALRNDWSSRVFRHLLRLPMRYFRARHVGDIQSRFGSLESLGKLVATTAVETVVDGLMTLSVVIVLYVYDALLGSIVVVSTLAYLGLRLATIPALHRRSREALVATAGKDSFFLESLRAVLTLRMAGLEHGRNSSFLGQLTEVANREVPVQRIQVLVASAGQLVFGLQLLLVVWFGARSITAGEFTVGMLVAFLAYRAQFSDRSAALINKLVELRTARVHLERVGDIAQTEPEPVGVVKHPFRPRISRIAVSKVGFSYGSGEPAVLADVNLDIRSGEFVAVTGPSGSGKSTLLHILLGLEYPASGELRVDDQALAAYGPGAYREKIAAVMQDDRLLAGTLAENISLFDTDIDMARVRRCATIAAIDEDIAAMPLQYFSRVGDLGSALSGGQRQRILLARALYRKPEVLYLDEASSHLDAESERRILSSLRELPLTIVAIAHRAETIRQADRVLRLERGTILPYARGTDVLKPDAA